MECKMRNLRLEEEGIDGEDHPDDSYTELEDAPDSFEDDEDYEYDDEDDEETNE